MIVEVQHDVRNKEEEALEDLRIFGLLVLTCLKSPCKSQSVLFDSDNCPTFQSALDAVQVVMVTKLNGRSNKVKVIF